MIICANCTVLNSQLQLFGAQWQCKKWQCKLHGNVDKIRILVSWKNYKYHCYLLHVRVPVFRHVNLQFSWYQTCSVYSLSESGHPTTQAIIQSERKNTDLIFWQQWFQRLFCFIFIVLDLFGLCPIWKIYYMHNDLCTYKCFPARCGWWVRWGERAINGELLDSEINPDNRGRQLDRKIIPGRQEIDIRKRQDVPIQWSRLIIS